MFEDEARFGRITRHALAGLPRVRPAVAAAIRQYTYLHGAISPKDGLGAYLVLPDTDTSACRYSSIPGQLRTNTSPCSRRRPQPSLPLSGSRNIPLSSAALQPRAQPRKIWDESAKNLQNYALKSMPRSNETLRAALYIQKPRYRPLYRPDTSLLHYDRIVRRCNSLFAWLDTPSVRHTAGLAASHAAPSSNPLRGSV